jgi:hypothetical protein
MKATVHLAPGSADYVPLFDGEERSLTEQQRREAMYREGQYIACRPIEVAIGTTPHHAAEEMFDLTNNPGRQEERERMYGTGRSVSTGDIVEVEEVLTGRTHWLCMSIGWKQINQREGPKT